ALHAERGGDELHRRLQLIRRHVLQDLNVLELLRGRRSLCRRGRLLGRRLLGRRLLRGRADARGNRENEGQRYRGRGNPGPEASSHEHAPPWKRVTAKAVIIGVFTAGRSIPAPDAPPRLRRSESTTEGTEGTEKAF